MANSNYNVTYERKMPYASGIVGSTGVCDTMLLKSTTPGEVMQVAASGYVQPFNSEAALMAVRIQLG